jgi:hypothetical protein
MKTQAVLIMTILGLAEVAWTNSTPIAETWDWTASHAYKLAPEDEYELKYGSTLSPVEYSRVPAEDISDSPASEAHSFKPVFEKGRF